MFIIYKNVLKELFYIYIYIILLYGSGSSSNGCDSEDRIT